MLLPCAFLLSAERASFHFIRTCIQVINMYSRYFTLGAASVLSLYSLPIFAVPHGKVSRNIQSRADNQTLNRERADAVKEAFTFAWTGYYKYAFPHDELHPVTNTYGDSRYTIRMPSVRTKD